MSPAHLVPVRLVAKSAGWDLPVIRGVTLAPSMSLEQGTHLGRYRIDALAGSGGMGEVYKAWDTKLDRNVAIKKLPESLRHEPHYRERLKREAKAISQLQHPHICTLYDVDKSDGSDYLVMEYLEGETLADRLDSRALTFAETCEIGRQVADAVDAAHACGLVHRDLKPANVMLTPTGAKVLDFGLAYENSDVAVSAESQAATRTRPLTEAGSLLGTVPYMAPEQLQGQTADERTDVWALGCLLYEMATGERPFEADNQASLISAILTSEPEPPSYRRPLTPERLDWVVARCLAKSPEERWQAAGDVSRQLEASPAAHPDDPAAELRRPDGSSPRRLILMAAAIVVAAAVWWVTRGSDPEASKMIVVPFENLGSEDRASFATGLADEIGTSLSRLGGLDVISRFSARQYTSGEATMEQLGDELDVDYALVGSVRYAGNRVRVTPTLVRISDETQLWSTTYDEVLTLDGVFDIQAAIAREVSELLGLTLSRLSDTGEAGLPTDNLDAYYAYLRGLEVAGRSGVRNLEQATRMYELAVEIDPEFAYAWAALGRTHAIRYFFGDRTPERAEEARLAVEKALELAPDLPEAQHAASQYYGVTGEAGKAVAALERAMRGLPGNAEIPRALAFQLIRRGDWDEGMELLERADRLDPRNSLVISDRTWANGYLRRFEEADSFAKRAIALDPESPDARYLRAVYFSSWKGFSAEHSYVVGGYDTWNAQVARALGDYERALALIDGMSIDYSTNDAFWPRSLQRAWVYRDLGDAEAARRAYEAARPIVEAALEDMIDPRVQSSAGLVYAGLGLTEKALQHGQRGLDLQDPDVNATQGPDRLWDLARIQAQVGEHSAALGTLERSLTIPGSFTVHTVAAEGAFASVRDAPGYGDLMRRFAVDVENPPGF